MSKTTKQVVAVAFAAAAAGYVAGILTAPKSGRETRQDIAQTADRTIREVEKRLKFAYSELSQLVASASDRAQEISGRAKVELEALVGKANIAKEKVRQTLSSFHEGEVTDDDLKAAVDDAEDSIDDLRRFLDK